MTLFDAAFSAGPRGESIPASSYFLFGNHYARFEWRDWHNPSVTPKGMAMQFGLIKDLFEIGPTVDSYSKDVDAACCLSLNEVYLFQGGSVLRAAFPDHATTDSADSPLTKPLPFRRLPFTKVDAALPFKDTDGATKIWCFSGDQCCKLKIAPSRVETQGPTSKIWRLPAGFASAIHYAVPELTPQGTFPDNGTAYLFHNDQWIACNPATPHVIGTPRNVNQTDWPLLRPTPAVTFTESGTVYIPDGIQQMTAYLWGGGGHGGTGGNGDGTTGKGGAGGDGGDGGYLAGTLSVVPHTNLQVTITPGKAAIDGNGITTVVVGNGGNGGNGGNAYQNHAGANGGQGGGRTAATGGQGAEGGKNAPNGAPSFLLLEHPVAGAGAGGGGSAGAAGGGSIGGVGTASHRNGGNGANGTTSSEWDASGRGAGGEGKGGQILSGYVHKGGAGGGHGPGAGGSGGDSGYHFHPWQLNAVEGGAGGGGGNPIGGGAGGGGGCGGVSEPGSLKNYVYSTSDTTVHPSPVPPLPRTTTGGKGGQGGTGANHPGQQGKPGDPAMIVLTWAPPN